MQASRKFIAVVIGLGLIATILFLSRVVFAKGVAAKIIISGENLTANIEVVDANLLEKLIDPFYTDNPGPLTEPLHKGAHYTLIRYELNDRGNYLAWDRLEYYLPTKGQSGYIFYDGLVNGYSSMDGQWYAASAQMDMTMQKILTTSQTGWQTTTNQVVILGVTILSLSGVIWIIATRKRFLEKQKALNN